MNSKLHRTGVLLSVAVLALTSVAPASGKELSSKLLKAHSEEVDALFADMTIDTPGCAVGVIHKGKFLHKKGYGAADIEHGVPITPTTIFRIGSTSKQFTAAAIASLILEEKLSPEDDIRKYLPELPEYEHTVRLKHLIHHSSGLPEYLEIGVKWRPNPDYYKEYPEMFGEKWDWIGAFEEYFPNSEYYAKIASVNALKFEPGSQYLYNNPAYFLMGQIVERVTGQTLREYADEKLFKPLGMNNTLFLDRGREVVKGRADGYITFPDGRMMVMNTDLDMVGEGGIFTTIEDFFLWDQNFYDEKLTFNGKSLAALMITPGDNVIPKGHAKGGKYAFGLQIIDAGELSYQQHNGWYGGFKSSTRRFQKLELTTLVFCNTPQVQPWQLRSKVEKIYLRDLATEPEKIEELPPA